MTINAPRLLETQIHHNLNFPTIIQFIALQAAVIH